MKVQLPSLTHQGTESRSSQRGTFDESYLRLPGKKFLVATNGYLPFWWEVQSVFHIAGLQQQDQLHMCTGGCKRVAIDFFKKSA